MRAKLTIAILTCSLLASAAAQGQTLLTERKAITGFGARKLVEACLSQAAREGYPIALAVTDAAGNLLSYEATNAQMAHTGLTAQLKAKTAAKFRRLTAELYDRINKQINRAPEFMGYFAVPGGFPVTVEGQIVGAMGAGSAGFSGGKDEGCVENAIHTVMGDGRSAPPPAPEPLIETRKVITMAAARKLVDACIAYADQKKFTALGIFVTDPDGTVLSSQGTDGATEAALTTAQLKATTAAHWQRTTAELFERVNKAVNRAPEFIGDFPQPGGFPIFIGNEIVGAIGAGGAIGNQDDECAQAAIKAVFPQATTARTS